MSTTLTIRNLDEGVEKRLRVQAARHGRSIEAEARDILAKGVEPGSASASRDAQSSGRFDHLVGAWKGRGSTDEVMQELRGDD